MLLQWEFEQFIDIYDQSRYIVLQVLLPSYMTLNLKYRNILVLLSPYNHCKSLFSKCNHSLPSLFWLLILLFSIHKHNSFALSNLHNSHLGHNSLWCSVLWYIYNHWNSSNNPLFSHQGRFFKILNYSHWHKYQP